MIVSFVSRLDVPAGLVSCAILTVVSCPILMMSFLCVSDDSLVCVPDSTYQPDWSPLYESSKLNSDALSYIHRIYCQECRMEEQRKLQLEQQPAQPTGDEGLPPTSPGVQDQSLQQAMDKNKECK